MNRKKYNYNIIIGAAVIALVSTFVVTGLISPPFDVDLMDYESILKPPSITHLFGTDNFGRDICSRVMQGAATTFGIALITVTIGAVIGTIVGALTGFYGGVADEVLMRVNDCLASFPSILLALVVVSILDVGTFNICIALGIVFIPSFARIMRGEFMAQRQRDYVQSARLMGASDIRIMFVHILPNTRRILLSSVLVGLNNAVLAEAGLSYLGLGVQPPDPSLGRMLAEAQVYIFSAPWYVISVSGVMVLALLGLSLVSENLGVSGLNLRAIKRRLERQRAAEQAAESSQTGMDSQAELSGHAGMGSPAEMSGQAELSGYAGMDRQPELNGQPGAVISARGLEVSYIEENGLDVTLRGISFDLREHEILGLVGESGSGKSLTALSVMGILPDKACVTGGEVFYRSKPLIGLDESEYCRLRGRDIAMIFQEPMTSLDPMLTIGDQLDEVLDLHMSELSAGEQRQRVIEALTDAGLKDAHDLYDRYPHELSGGMRQRVMIAMALITRADVIIADEPTTALDADVAEVIIDLFRSINEKYGTSIILITHDLRIVERVCDRALVMRDGMIEEELQLGRECSEKNMTDGSGFPQPVTEYGRRLLNAAFSDVSYVDRSDVREDTPLVRARGLTVAYPSSSGVFSGHRLKKVIDGLDFEIHRGETVGVVGPSGCGKTTLVKAIAGLQRYVTGELELMCDRPGMVFQDPAGSLNPAMRVGRLLEEPLRLASFANRGHRMSLRRIIRSVTSDRRSVRLAKRQRIDEVLNAVGLENELIERRITELSGGQKQRVSIALNILLRHELIILDEPLSALDVTLQEQVLELLMKLKNEYGLTYILITHDRRLVRRVCDRVIEMK